MTTPTGDPQGYQPAPGYQGAPQYSGGPAAPTTPPPSIQTAKKLMWAGGIVQLLSLLTIPLLMDDMRAAAEESLRESGQTLDQDVLDASVAVGIGFGVVMGILGAALWFAMAHFNAKGRSWARITATVLFAIYVLTFLMSFVQPNPPLTQAINVLVLIIGAAAVFFLWRKDASDWFVAHGR